MLGRPCWVMSKGEHGSQVSVTRLCVLPGDGPNSLLPKRSILVNRACAYVSGALAGRVQDPLRKRTENTTRKHMKSIFLRFMNDHKMSKC